MTFENMTNVSTVSDWITHTNAVTSQLWGHVLLLTLFIITFMALGNKPREDAFAAASFITFVVSVLLWAMGAVSAVGVILTTTAMIASVILLLMRKA